MFTKFFTACKQLIAPPLCAHCKTFMHVEDILCAGCVELIQPIVSAQLSISKDNLLSVHAVSAYKAPIKQLILAKGWRDIVASKQLGYLVWQYTSISCLDFDYIIPIPLHWTRFMVRGYNQADEIASVISMKSKKQIINLLRRNRKTAYQASLSAQERKKNLHKAFSLIPKNTFCIKDKHILLVDDLMTTGATLQAAARALQVYEPRKISIVVAARVI